MQALLETLSSVGFDWHIAFANFVNFMIVFAVLYFLLFKKIAVTLALRSKKIEQGLDDAAKSKHLLSVAEKSKEALIKEAEDKHMRILEDAEVKALALADDITKEAKDKAETLLSSLEKEKKHLSEQVEKEFNEKAPAIVASLFAKSLQASMTKEANDAFSSALASK